MSAVVNMHLAKTTLSRLVERALAGEEVIIGRAGKPLVRLVPVPSKAEPRVPGRSKGRVWISPDFELTDEEIDDFEAPL
jgi:prevent-host-death family protein